MTDLDDSSLEQSCLGVEGKTTFVNAICVALNAVLFQDGDNFMGKIES